VTLRADEPASAAVRRVLVERLAELRRRVGIVLRNDDPAALHDLRTALRRTRTVLAETKEVLPDRIRLPSSSGLRRLSERSGPLRDLDVLLGGLGSSPELAPLRELLGRRRARARARLVAELSSTRQEGLPWSRRLEALLRAPRSGAGGWPLPPGGPGVGSLVARRARRRWKRLLRRGAHLDARSSPEDLHALRIQARKLRHLLEVFREACPPRQRTHWIVRTKRLQRTLGDLHDAHVGARELAGAARELARSGAPARSLRAIAGCIEGYERREARARARFEGRFRELAALDADRLAPPKRQEERGSRRPRVVGFRRAR